VNTQIDPPRDRDELLAQIVATRKATLALLDRLDDERLNGPRDAAGWNAQDHFYHLIGWRQILLARLRDEPEHRAVGLPDQESYRALCDSEDLRAINQHIVGRGRALGRDEVRAQFIAIDEQVVSAVQDRDFDALTATMENASGDSTSLLDTIAGNTYDHDPYHYVYIRRVIGEE
jgi:hypothetical protein